ncbi:hypothetical protein TKWG_17365 [Advenella kashmirensis WT001]|uniref:Uncharacterized protein n=1 Tax=Advenella kashmirensis (strain DSM 17095 / LMG 22695 / WT001) TaxID=1036672 RepID=I3UEE0_ADVKW|nr:hypothetical protein TKWG_17365 [Advenella kashmirensis WT001]
MASDVFIVACKCATGQIRMSMLGVQPSIRANSVFRISGGKMVIMAQSIVHKNQGLILTAVFWLPGRWACCR